MVESRPGITASFLLYDPTVDAVADIDDPRLGKFTERHRFALDTAPPLQSISDILAEIASRPAGTGVLIKLDGGLPGMSLLRTSGRILRSGRRLLFFWPAEGAVEVVDDLRLKSFRRHWLARQIYRRLTSRKQGAAALRAKVATDDASAVVDLMRRRAETISTEIGEWKKALTDLNSLAAPLRDAANRIGASKIAEEKAALLAALGQYGDGLKTAITNLVRARLAADRIGSCLDDLAAATGRPSISRAISPLHLLGIKATTVGAGQEIENIADECKRNLPGVFNAAQMVRGALEGCAGDLEALDQAIAINAAVVARLAAVFDGYFKTVHNTAQVAVPLVEEACTHVLERLAQISVPLTPWPSAQPFELFEPQLAPAPNAITKRALSQLRALLEKADRVPLVLAKAPTTERPIPGTALYLRTDYWAPILSGGSYGHTCYQARALARRTEYFICVLANRFPLLDELRLRQIVVRPEGLDNTETSLIRANDYYYAALKPALQMIQPAYLFERLCLGNYAVARLSAELGIPYIAEYNGSEISMKRSFDTRPYEQEELYLRAERYSFEQASTISVISDAVRDDVIKRGVDPAKILVNWNAVDLDAYRPLPPERREKLRADLGFSPAHRVVCFTGTFGGWHGIEVLAAALPRIAAASAQTRFLLIGDGNFKHIVREAIERARLGERVTDVGRVEQKRGAELMAAADVFVSPHSSHMGDSRFFGSPTKLFEYMAHGVGIVASDLEQIGEVLTPALRASEARRTSASQVGSARGVLCKPGDVDELVAGVVALVDNPALATALGHNALSAAAGFSWDRHVEKLWDHVAKGASIRASQQRA